MQRAYPPFLFTIALYLVVLKDALRVVEYEASLPFPLSAPTAVILLILITYNVYRIAAQRVANGLALGWIGLIVAIFVSVTLHLAPGELINPRDFFGIALVQLLIPLAALTSAIAYDLTAYFSRSVHVSLIILAVLLSALGEVAFIAFDKTTAANFLVGLYKAGLIAYPIQTAAGSFSVRAPGLFYSAFALALFCTWVVALGIFQPRRNWWRLSLALLALVVLGFTINRNGIIMCGAVLAMRMLFGKSDRISEWKIAVVGLAAAAFIVLVPVVSLSSDISTTDDSVYGKTSTMATRANTWSDLLTNQWLELSLGTGSVQGVEIEGREPVLVDNLFLYISYQDGIAAAIIAAILLFCTFWRLLQERRNSEWTRMYVALFTASALGFALNIVFFEPIYQFLFLAPILSAIGSAGRADQADFMDSGTVDQGALEQQAAVAVEARRRRETRAGA